MTDLKKLRLPTQHDLMSGPIDLDPLYHAALAASMPTAVQAQIIEVLREGRDSAALERIRALQPVKPYESYEKKALIKRSNGRVDRMKRATKPLFSQSIRLRALDIGAARGEFLEGLCSASTQAIEGVGLDIAPRLFVERRAQERELDGIVFLQAPAERIPVVSDTFDLITAFNSMEHFEKPEVVLRECARVLRPGGFAYFHFGPPFHGPFGPHLQNRFGLPYFHHFFARDVVRAALKTGDNPYAGKNEWSTRAFRELFTTMPDLECSLLVSEFTWDHLWLVRAFPEVFAKYAAEELVVRAFEVALRKKGQHLPLPVVRASTKPAPAVMGNYFVRQAKKGRAKLRKMWRSAQNHHLFPSKNSPEPRTPDTPRKP